MLEGFENLLFSDWGEGMGVREWLSEVDCE